MPTQSAARVTPSGDTQERPQNLQFFDYAPSLGDDRTAILNWLTEKEKTPPARLLYDAKGAQLFEEICATEEYYLTNREEALLPDLAAFLKDHAQPASQIVEYGSGNLRKIALLLSQCPNLSAHVPIDISKEHLLENASALAEAFPNKAISAICADFFQPITLPDRPFGQAISQNVGFFPGSTIGNMPAQTAAALLSNARDALGDGCLFALAVDRVKSPNTLVDAYLDPAGASAAFSLNLIDRINREMDGTLQKSAFHYDATYNSDLEAIEMWWVVDESHEAMVSGQALAFEQGQRLLVEISRKFTPHNVETLASDSGFTVLEMISSPDDWYSLAILQG